MYAKRRGGRGTPTDNRHPNNVNLNKSIVSKIVGGRTFDYQSKRVHDTMIGITDCNTLLLKAWIKESYWNKYEK